MAKKTMTFEQMAAGRLAAIHTIMDRYTKAGIVMVPSLPRLGCSLNQRSFTTLLDWLDGKKNK